jgi:hypothetical protein
MKTTTTFTFAFSMLKISWDVRLVVIGGKGLREISWDEEVM